MGLWACISVRGGSDIYSPMNMLIYSTQISPLSDRPEDLENVSV